MENNKTLRDIPAEYFGKFRNIGEDKGTLWGTVIVCLLFFVFSLGFYTREGSIRWTVTLTIICFALLMIFPAIFFSFRKTVSRFRKGFIVCSIISMEIFCLQIMSFFTGVNSLYSDGLFLTDKGSVVVYAIGGGIFLQHIVLLVLFWKRIKKCIINGCYLTGGTGFWTKKLLPKIALVSVIMPMLFSIAARLARNGSGCSGSITLTESLFPFVAFFFFLLAELIGVLFAYGNANLIGRYSYVKIHGCNEDADESE